MKKIMYLLCIGLMFTLLGCGSPAATKETPAPIATPESAPAPVVEKKWAVTQTFEGSTRKTTESFTVGKDTRVSWEVDKNNTGFMLYLLDAKGEVAADIASVREGEMKEVTSVIVEPGEYSMEIIASSKYKVVFEQKQ